MLENDNTSKKKNYNSPLFVCAQERQTKQAATRSSKLVAVVFNAITRQAHNSAGATLLDKKNANAWPGTRLAHGYYILSLLVFIIV